jgi:hypothetical protein
VTDDEIRGLFREMREDPVPGDSLVRVRTKVQHRVRRRSQWKILAFALASVAVLIAGLVIRTPAHVDHQPLPRIAAHRQEIPRPETVTAPPVTPAIRRTHRPPKPSPGLAAIRIETPDPEVVIILVGDDRAERN